MPKKVKRRGLASVTKYHEDPETGERGLPYRPWLATDLEPTVNKFMLQGRVTSKNLMIDILLREAIDARLAKAEQRAAKKLTSKDFKPNLKP